MSEDAVKEYLEHSKLLEQEAIKHAAILAEESRKENADENGEKAKASGAKNSKDTTASEVSVSIEVPQNSQDKEEENSPLIYGRSAKLKEALVKIIDLSVDSGKVVLDGEIINIDSRELKSGKVLVMFDLFDGSMTANLYGKTKKNVKVKALRDYSDMYLSLISCMPIISNEDWFKAQEIKGERNYLPPRSNSSKISFLCGLVKCGKCVSNMVTQGCKNKKGKTL